ncbi:cell division protein ZapE [Pseudidiomarina planktonica]|uniref:Cell division protein ZapE n=1 Tax=Pseudidiomarina planktonica TaxID=1323738 RepID=A0A1Y6EJ31_9GAMM|nr:cell division protein ZapE [Pseudidiomarina planktonica]RUO66082.1 cell division protein ZapE [Pseudidiomarina planktonica]SMQ60602.1 cell division protein ZapE [Pseudidiomarina planktonica]
MKTPWQQYQSDLQRDDFEHDPAQQQAVEALQRLYDDLLAWRARGNGWLAKLRQLFSGPAKAPQGLYFWGGVGRGKTYLVDTFYNALPFEQKQRVHFHRFMHRVHEELKGLKGVSDPLPIIAEKLAGEAQVLCFDEFFVQDITDAMLLGTLMQELFKRQVVLIATSNIVPDQLYKNGLQRERFLPAIALINQNCQVLNVDGGVDYRLRTLTQAEIYHAPLDADADENLLNYFFQLAPDHQSHCTDGTITINGRDISVRRETDDVVLFDFMAICGGPRSQNDYIEIARLYHAVLISDLPQLGSNNDDAARRFIALVDEFYERRVKLIMSAAVSIEQLYSGGKLEFEFKRCISRLKEMQSHEYLALGHLA